MKTQIYVPIKLTGSNFFDMVITEWAGELTRSYPGLSVRREGENLVITGELEPEQAESFRREVE